MNIEELSQKCQKIEREHQEVDVRMRRIEREIGEQEQEIIREQRRVEEMEADAGDDPKLKNLLDEDYNLLRKVRECSRDLQDTLRNERVNEARRSEQKIAQLKTTFQEKGGKI